MGIDQADDEMRFLGWIERQVRGGSDCFGFHLGLTFAVGHAIDEHGARSRHGCFSDAIKASLTPLGYNALRCDAMR